jgi:phasin family protein
VQQTPCEERLGAVLCNAAKKLESVPMADALKPHINASPAPVVPDTKPLAKLEVAVNAAEKSAPTSVETSKPTSAKSVAKRKPSAREARMTTKTAQPAAAAAPEQEDITMDAMQNDSATIQGGYIQDKAKDMMAQASERTKDAVEKSQKMIGEMNEFSKGNVEAMVESSKIAAKGMETMGQDAVAYARKSFEDATAAAKQLASVKSPTEFMKLQSDYVRSSFDAMVAHTSKSTEAMLKLAGEVAQPISNRVSLAAEKVKVAA